MIKNVFFDFNGTILDDLALCVEIEQEMMIMKGIKPYTTKEYCNKFYFPINSYYHDVGFSDEDFLYLADFFNTQYNNRWFSETKLFPNVKESLMKLKANGIRLYCLSATKEDFLKEQLIFLGILDLFDGVCGAKDNLAHGKIGYGKLFIREHNIDPSETIMFGDTEHDYEVAKAFHFDCILFTKGHNSRERLQKLGVTLVDSYQEIVDYALIHN